MYHKRIPPLLGHLGYAINKSGQVTGESNNHAFRTTATGKITTASDPGTGGLPSHGVGINASGQ
jgi:hypothetical protein